MIDQSQDDFGQSQFVEPRDNRGLALSPDGRYLYAGYNNGPEVRKIDLLESDYIDASVASRTDIRGKSIDVDDVGRVYLGEGSTIKVFDADLTTQLFSIATTKCEGVTVRRESGTLALYGTDRTDATLTRWELAEDGAGILSATQAGLDGDGQIVVAGAQNLRGLAVDDAGRIWMADISADKVFRVDGDGGGLASVDVISAIDVGLYGGGVFISQYEQRAMTVLDASDFSLIDVMSPSWADLKLDEDGQSSNGALSGIAMLPGAGLFVTNESGQTADEHSIYGRTDDQSGWQGDVFYTDLTHDDNDPIFFVPLPQVIPEPATMGLLAAAGVGLLARRRRH